MIAISKWKNIISKLDDDHGEVYLGKFKIESAEFLVLLAFCLLLGVGGGTLNALVIF